MVITSSDLIPLQSSVSWEVGFVICAIRLDGSLREGSTASSSGCEDDIFTRLVSRLVCGTNSGASAFNGSEQFSIIDGVATVGPHCHSHYASNASSQLS